MLGAAACAAVVCATSSARANGRFPASNQILFSPASTTEMVVRTTFGVLITNDSAKTWRWLCEDTLGLPPTSNEDPYYVITANGNLVAGLSLGLQLSTDTGCDWAVKGGPLAGQLIKDLDIIASNQHAVDLITSTYSPTGGADGGSGYAQQAFETTDDGVTWSAFGAAIDPTAIVTTIDVAPSDPNRIYVSAFRGQGTTRTGSLFVSSDKGTTWTEHTAPLDPNLETAVYIGAVDPTNEDIVYLRSEGQSRLSVTKDGGQTFTSVKTLDDEMLGLALSQDGSKIYIGSVADGLLVAPTSTLSFTTTSMIHVQCLTTHGADLWACSDEVSGFVVGVSQNDGKTFTPMMHLLDITSPIVCPAKSTAAECTAWDLAAGDFYNPFVGLCSNLGACEMGPASALTSECNCTGACAAYTNSVATDYNAAAVCPASGGSDAGTGSDGGADAGVSHGSSSSSCGCSTVGASGAAGALAGATALALAALSTRRRRARRGGRR
jgi:MYXO-CTERM domain-containing protein